MNHSFNVELAIKYGVNSAILFENMYFWIKKNQANDTNYFDGNYWTFNSIRAYEELFPYMSQKQIKTALDKLVDEGLVIVGDYNKDRRDRTKWYAITEKGFSIYTKGKMHLPKKENALPQKGEPLPYINTDINTDINSDIYIGEFPVESHCEEIPYKEIIDYLNQKTGKHYRANIKKTKECINARWKEGFRLDDFRQVIDNKCSQWLNNKDMKKYLRPQTLFGTKFESYLNEDEQSQDDDIWAKMMRGEI